MQFAKNASGTYDLTGLTVEEAFALAAITGLGSGRDDEASGTDRAVFRIFDVTTAALGIEYGREGVSRALLAEEAQNLAPPGFEPMIRIPQVYVPEPVEA